MALEGCTGVAQTMNFQIVWYINNVQHFCDGSATQFDFCPPGTPCSGLLPGQSFMGTCQ